LGPIFWGKLVQHGCFEMGSMKITEVRTTPLIIPYKTPFHWAQRTVDGAVVILVEVHTDEGIVGYGECIGTPSASAIQAHLNLAAKNMCW